MIIFWIGLHSTLWAKSNVLLAGNQHNPTIPLFSFTQYMKKEITIEMALPLYDQEVELLGINTYPRIMSLYWEKTTEQNTQKTSIGLQPVDWGLGLYRQSRDPWFGLNTLGDRQVRFTHGGYIESKNIFWWLSGGSQYQSSQFLYYPLLEQKIYPLTNVGIYKKGFLGEWGFFWEWERTAHQMWQSPLNSYTSLRILPDLALKNETLFLLTKKNSTVERLWAHVWQLEYKQNNQGFRFELGHFPDAAIQPHANQQIFVVPTPLSQYWKTSQNLIQTNDSTGYFRMLGQTQSGNWMLRIGTSWLNKQSSERQLWNPNQKTKEYMLRIGRYQSINNKKHQLRILCDGTIHVEKENIYWLILPQIQYEFSSAHEQTQRKKQNIPQQKSSSEIQNAL
jgi:hypothetical protein